MFIHTTSNDCMPEAVVKFPLDLFFQQPTEPIPQKYTLNTTFHLIRKRSLSETSANKEFNIFTIGK